MDDIERALEVLAALSALGISLSIDDFGTGYSSLAYLAQLPVDEVKIDKSFVMGMTDRDVIVGATIGLAHALGRRTVAEGVECPEVWDRLSALGCDLIQGFGLLRPAPAQELTAWLAEPGRPPPCSAARYRLSRHRLAGPTTKRHRVSPVGWIPAPARPRPLLRNEGAAVEGGGWWSTGMLSTKSTFVVTAPARPPLTEPDFPRWLVHSSVIHCGYVLPHNQYPLWIMRVGGRNPPYGPRPRVHGGSLLSQRNAVELGLCP